MKLIATETGRVLQLIVMEEVLPLSGLYMPILYQQLTERYAFVGHPQDYGEGIAKGAKFQHGRLITPTKTIVIKEIGLYNDGLIVDAHNTDDAEFITEDVLEWARTAFAFRGRQTIIPRLFTSITTVEFDGAIEPALIGLTKISKCMSDAYSRAYSHEIDTHLLRLSFQADPLLVPPFRNTQFFIERRIQRPYSENRYQCGAPLRTEDHIELLKTIEATVLRANASV
jgi:hypothetical protein